MESRWFQLRWIHIGCFSDFFPDCMILEDGGSIAGSDADDDLLLEENTAAEVRGLFLFCYDILWEV